MASAKRFPFARGKQKGREWQVQRGSRLHGESREGENGKWCDPNIVFPAKAGILKNMQQYYVYILTNYQKTVLYIGFTGNLVERIYQHKSFKIDGFTKKYKTDRLIYFESFADVNEAKARERSIKKWKRSWKEELINKSNPQWDEIVI